MLSDDELDPHLRHLALRNEGAVTKAMQTITLTKAAERLGLAKSTLSTWNETHLKRAMQVLAAFDLLAVPKDAPVVAPDEWRAYMTLASARMEEMLRRGGE